jgi:hypothetical protein
LPDPNLPICHDQYKGDYEAALEQYRRSLEIEEKIGNIAGMAESFGQMGG